MPLHLASLSKSQLDASYAGQFPAAGDGSTETAALQAAVTAAAGGIFRLPNKTIKTGKIIIPSGGLTLDLGRCVIDYIDDGTTSACLFEALDGSDFTIIGGMLKSSNASSRSSLYGLIRTRGWDGFRVRGTKFGKSSSTAIWMSTTTNFIIEDIDIDGTYADGVHVSRGSKHGTIQNVRGKNTGDDLIGINAYTNDGATNYDNIEDITIRDIKGQNIGTGRGVAVNGGKSITVDDVTIDGVAQAAVLVSKVTGQTYSPSDVWVDNVVARNTGQNIPPGGTSGAVYMANLAGGRLGRNIVGTVTIDSTARVRREDRPSGDELSAGAETMPPLLAKDDITMSTQTLRLTLFTANRDETVSNVTTYSTTTPAGATPTLIRKVLYKVEDNGDLTLVASTANDTSLYSVGNTEYVKALTSPYTYAAGQRYAGGVLVVTAGTAPTILGSGSSTRPNQALLGRSGTRKTGARTGQTDLPASITTGVLANTTSAIYIAFT